MRGDHVADGFRIERACVVTLFLHDGNSYETHTCPQRLRTFFSRLNSGEGTSKKLAKHRAAEAAINILKANASIW